MGSRWKEFDGKPDPWPNDVGLTPNEALKAAYVARYGQTPGNPSEEGKTVPGFFDELFTANYWACKNFFGSEPSYTEQVDCAFLHRKGDKFYEQYWWIPQSEGSTPEKAIHVNYSNKPSGLYSEKNSFGYSTYYFNDYTSDGHGDPPPPPPPPPVDVVKEVPINIVASISDTMGDFDEFQKWKGLTFIGRGRQIKIDASNEDIVRVANWITSLKGVVYK